MTNHNHNTPGAGEPDDDTSMKDLGIAGNLTRAFIKSPLTPLFLIAAFAFGLVAFGFLGMGPVTIAVDSFGPVTDNAQSVYELSRIEHHPGIRKEIEEVIRFQEKVGLDVLAFVRLDAERNRGDITRQLEEAILKIPEVISCHYISGTGTFELQVVSKDLNTFSQFARDVLINLPNVKDLHTSFSLGEVKAAAALPLSHLLDRHGT